MLLGLFFHHAGAYDDYVYHGNAGLPGACENHPGTGRDQGEAERAEQAARESEQTAKAASQAKTEFLTNMSHEIRTPINGILGYNEMIMKETKESATAEYAINVQAAGRTLLSIVNDILDFTDIEKGELTMEQEPYFVMSLLQDVLTYAEYNAQKKGLKLRVDIDEKLPRQLSGIWYGLCRSLIT